MPGKKVKLYLITGFLGAGKTTLLKGLLNLFSAEKSKKGSRVGVVMNEFGKVNIDSTVIKKDGIEYMEINNGSIFCKCLEGSFINHVAAFAKMPVEYLFVESSGLSDPSSMESIFRQVNIITKEAFSFEGTICVVDARNFLKVFNSLNTVERQIFYSDYIIINKVDLVDRETMDKVTAKIREINPVAKITETTYCRIDEDIFAKSIKEPAGPCPADSTNTCFNRPQTVLLKTYASMNKENLLKFIEEIKEKVLRVKGVIRLQNAAYRLDIAGSEVYLKETEISQDNSEIVMILHPENASREEIEKSWRSHVGSNFVII